MATKIVLCCTALHCTVLYCTVLCCAVLCCAVLHFGVSTGWQMGGKAIGNKSSVPDFYASILAP